MKLITSLFFSAFAVLTMPGTTTGHAQSVVSAVDQLSSAHTLAGLDKRITVSFTETPLREAIREVIRQSGVKLSYRDNVLPERYEVTLRLENTSARAVLRGLLNGTGFELIESSNGGAAIAKRASGQKTGQGVIAGKITDTKSGRGIAGANVSIGQDNRGTLSSEDGSYRILGITAGLQTVTVRLVGYAKQTRTITVGEGATVTADFKLEQSANVLDQVVVTGTVASTELRAVPNAITVITAKQIEERGITRIEQLFRGDIPGLFAQNRGSAALVDEVFMFSRGATTVDPVASGTTDGTNPIKTYIDGVEMADPKYLSQIDPRSIERIEILTGPQASTIYGSNALNGVMQVFTKRGSSPRPRIILNLLSGWVENSQNNVMTPQHDHTVNIDGVEGRLSYSAGGAWNYVGPWTPAKQTARTNVWGGSRFVAPSKLGKATIDLMIRRSLTENHLRGLQNEGAIMSWATGLLNPATSPVADNGVASPRTDRALGESVGLTLGYLPVSWWSHEFAVGRDGSDAETIYTARGYTSPTDTNLKYQKTNINRRSQRYTTTLSVPIASVASATLTAGADAWQNLITRWSADPQLLTGTLTNVTSMSRQPDHNAGGFLQTQVGILDRVYLTYGLRAEWNPSFGSEAEPYLAPRYGVAYTRDFGAITTKLRGSYGRSTRPPTIGLRAAQKIGASLTGVWGNIDVVLANPELEPEYQQGGEGGIEVYMGNRASLTVTRYNQTVDALISLVSKIDSATSIRSLRNSASIRPRALNGRMDMLT